MSEDIKMIERVARAIADTAATMNDTPYKAPWRFYVTQARAAIEAMRDPTPAMIDDGSDIRISEREDYMCGRVHEDTARCWRRMINAALAEE